MSWQPPADWLRIGTIDAHTGGEPLRLITSGVPEPSGATMLDKRRNAKATWDHLRRALMWEPRGHPDMYGALLTAPVTTDGDTGVLFLHNEGFSTMCGHGIIAVVTAGVETGLLKPTADGTIRIDTPAGRVEARAHVSEGRVERVSFRNVPSFVLAKDLVVDVPGVGSVTCDIAFGGAFYAYLDAASVGARLEPGRYAEIIDVGMRIKRAVAASSRIVHPAGASDLDFLYGVILCETPAPSVPGLHSRNVCIFAEGEVDRSPTGTGVSGRAAIHHARGELAIGETIAIESLVGSRFDVRVVETTFVGHGADVVPAVIPEVTGSAWITGRHEFWIDPRDPFREGFLLR